MAVGPGMKMNRDENCVEMNTWHERKMSRIKMKTV